ncbi:MAG: hypothetical protein A2087_03570 [Spirochaetes bacterium GWD1_61_31]|nr:MAG: hypothetical protein A2Y37_11330 [Spirochaetes bacterium GWB1_60_80]OHD32457.1 MAG: hypothetical protein A2004_09375 [Spirochaetes bacterium GWC1_61_12]OHD36136.1 MAG: hypothetical protein A2087_03570 [Spirochaetes bacterium GWD1_61_31]OHD45022.1 MAG: hypothetical protein A2Y35_13375 [Spirochaetes bacterium GWE1_60_18]OHD60133.1 MAG: hypothetical protein A2Y32_11490 [Spirochaetes bacterium GWF1_60_12]
MQQLKSMRIVIALALLMLAGGLAVAGDVATLVNLGFSADSNYYMFGYYGMDAATAKPYAEIYIVDTRSNSFVPNGVFRGSYAVAPQPGLNPAGAFYRLFAEALPTARRYNIDHLIQGRIIYLFMDTGERPDTISFRDFRDNSQWDVNLRETIEQRGDAVSSSFGINFSLTRTDGRVSTFNAGNPQFRRANVVDYAIQQIVLGPDNRTVVFIVDRAERVANQPVWRYMVETIRQP